MKRFARTTEMTLLVICVVFFVFLVIASHGDLLEANSLRVLLQFLAVPVLIGLAQMVVLAVGQLNLAVGAMGGFAACAMGVMMADHGVPVPLALLIGFVLASVAGLVNGLLVVLTRINGFIVTLATMTVLLGVQYRLVGTRTVDAYPQGLKSFGSYAVFGVLPLIFLVALVVAGAARGDASPDRTGPAAARLGRKPHRRKAFRDLQRPVGDRRAHAVRRDPRRGRDPHRRLVARREQEHRWRLAAAELRRADHRWRAC